MPIQPKTSKILLKFCRSAAAADLLEELPGPGAAEAREGVVDLPHASGVRLLLLITELHLLRVCNPLARSAGVF